MHRSKWPAITSLTDSTGGAAGATLADVGAAFSQATLNDNFATLAAKLEEVLAQLRNTREIEE